MSEQPNMTVIAIRNGKRMAFKVYASSTKDAIHQTKVRYSKEIIQSLGGLDYLSFEVEEDFL